MHLVVVDAVKWFDHHEVIFLLGVFKDGRFDRCKVLLVRQVYVVEERALPGEERAREL